ncbi:hypothetical protein, partial [Paraburkholderia sp. MM5384-R2]|uniref:hypothetical protein n=1 Tax=Paraburkholderia sp. MM5384-R2 TaxID=2723097 RepID=UPI001C850AAE
TFSHDVGKATLRQQKTTFVLALNGEALVVALVEASRFPLARPTLASVQEVERNSAVITCKDIATRTGTDQDDFACFRWG